MNKTMTQDKTSHLSCPQCSHKFTVDDLILHPILQEQEKAFASEKKALSKNLAQLKQEQALLDQEKKDLKKNIELDLQKKLKAEYEDKLQKQIKINLDAQLDLQKKEVEKELKAAFEKNITQKAQEQFQNQFNELNEQLNEKQTMLEQAQKQELNLRKKERMLLDQQKNIELEVERKSQELIESSLQKQQHLMQLQSKSFSEKENGYKKQVEILQQKLAQGSMQLQGEAQEILLKDQLQQSYPQDQILDVEKGKQGADLIQNVLSSNGAICGKILWESKNTKQWQNAWIEKLIDDKTKAKANIAIIVSKTLPKNINSIGQIQNVWITHPKYALNLAMILRQNLQSIHKIKQSNTGKHAKMELMYQYLSGDEFKHRVQTIIDAFSSMQEDLNKEKISMQKHWSKREKQLQRVLENTSGLYGDLEGIIGEHALPQIENLQLLE